MFRYILGVPLEVGLPSENGPNTLLAFGTFHWADRPPWVHLGPAPAHPLSGLRTPGSPAGP